MKTKPEILAPAGDMFKLKTALAFGADAVYAGIPKFSLRTREAGFTHENLQEAIDYTHSLGKKIYITLNIYPHSLKVDSFLKDAEFTFKVRLTKMLNIINLDFINIIQFCQRHFQRRSIYLIR
jgi:collagenase-like PrtC family protease